MQGALSDPEHPSCPADKQAVRTGMRAGWGPRVPILLQAWPCMQHEMYSRLKLQGDAYGIDVVEPLFSTAICWRANHPEELPGLAWALTLFLVPIQYRTRHP